MDIQKRIGNLTINCRFNDEKFTVIDGELYLGWPVPVNGRIEGIFVRITEAQDSISLENDLFGLYRLYYWIDGDQMFITDDTDNFISLEQYRKLEILPEEKELFEKSLGYTSGDSTFYKKIRKLPPASRMTVDKDGVHTKFLFPFRNIERTPDKEKHISLVRQEVTNMLAALKGRPEKIILFYSGGSDSYYLAEVLTELGMPFTPVFIYDTARSKAADVALAEAKAGALKLSIPNLEIIEINSQDHTMDRAIANSLRFDRHFGKLHFFALQKITQKYGNRIIIVNGQNSDSIFSYGPSEKTFSSLIKRYLMYGHNVFLKFCIAVFCAAYCRRPMRFPHNLKEYYFSQLTNHRYIKLYDLSYSGKTRKFFEEKISDLLSKYEVNRNCMEMFLKIFYFIHGPDSQVVIQSAKYFKIPMLILPFATSETVKATLTYKDDEYELLHPKYCIRIPNNRKGKTSL